MSEMPPIPETIASPHVQQEEATTPHSQLDVPQWPELHYNKFGEEVTLRPFTTLFGKPRSLELMAKSWILGGIDTPFQEIALDAVYNSLTLRPETLAELDKKGWYRESKLKSPELLGKRFKEIIDQRNKERESEPDKQIDKDRLDIGGELYLYDGHFFHYNGHPENVREKPESENHTIRAYLTIGPEQFQFIPQHFAGLLFALKAEGITEFYGKALDPYAATHSTANMVFYFSSTQVDAAKKALETYLQDNPQLGDGYIKAGFPSEQNGLTWAAEPDENQIRIIQEIEGKEESKHITFNMFVACMSLPAYLTKLKDFYQLHGRNKDATILQAEIERVESIINAYTPPDTIPGEIGFSASEKVITHSNYRI